MKNPHQVGTANGQAIVADVALGDFVAVTMLADYAPNPLPGFPRGLPGAAVQSERIMPAGSRQHLLACEARALIAAGVATLITPDFALRAVDGNRRSVRLTVPELVEEIRTDVVNQITESLRISLERMVAQ